MQNEGVVAGTRADNNMSTPPKPLATRFHEDAGFLSTSVRSKDSGIEGATIWFFAGEYTHGEGHDAPRIEVVLGDQCAFDSLLCSVPVTLATPCTVLGTLPDNVTKQVTDFVERNRRTLIRHWQGEIDSLAALALLAPVD